MQHISLNLVGNMDDPIRLFHDDGTVLLTRFRPYYACYYQMGLEWEILPSDHGELSRQKKPLPGAHMQVIEAEIHFQVTVPYRVIKPTCFLLVLYRGYLQFFNKRSQLVSSVNEPCMYLSYDPASTYNLILKEGLHSFLLLAFDKDWAITNKQHYPMFAPLVDAWSAAETSPLLLPCITLTEPMLELLETLRKIRTDTLEGCDQFQTNVSQFIELYHDKLEICRDTLEPYKEILRVQVDSIIKSLSIPDTNISANHICNTLGWSRVMLDRVSKACYGTTVSRYIAAVRMEKACHMLLHTKENIKQIAFEVGFAGLASFSKTFIRIMGIAPRMYRKGHKSKKSANGPY